MNNQFSENLKRIRKENNLSQEQLADELGVSRQAISKWESAVAYPEMDKIIALCEKFNVNIDDLLHKDIKEVKGEEESKKKLNSSIDDFLKFITNTINLFSNMNFKSKIKCLFEQIVIAVILFLSSLIIYYVISDLLFSFISFLPQRVYSFINSFLDSIIILALLIASIIIMTHIFKTRYLDYYEKIKKDSRSETEEKKELENQKTKTDNADDTDEKNKIMFKRNEDKIIIRDPKHSEYKFINSLIKFIIGVIKFFSLLFGLFVIFVLIGLLCTFVVSFLISKTGFFFVGLLLSILSSIVITVIVLLLIMNFVFNRKNDKKKMIWSFVLSIIVFGIGLGFMFLGSLDFEVYDDDYGMIETKTTTLKMNDNLAIFNYYNEQVNYIESNDTDVKVEYKINKSCYIREYKNDNVTIDINVECDEPIKLVREFLNNVNNKKIIPISQAIYEVNIYTNKKNISIIKSNVEKELARRKEYEEEVNGWERQINELEAENRELRQKVDELQEKIDFQE